MKAAESRLQAKITKLYIDMRLKRISKLNWMMESEKTVETLRQLEHTDIIPELYYTHLLITKEAYDAVEDVMDEAADWLRAHSQEAPASHAYYLYLTTLTQEDEAHDIRVAAKLSELAAKYPDIWQIQWLLYYADRELSGKPLEQYHFLKRMFMMGCRSPLMYIEARALIERNPTFLYEFSEFEVQLMVFMLRHAGMSERISDILTGYMLQKTDYRYIYLIILCGCYELKPSRRILESICRMLVLGGCTGEKFTRWYRKGMAEHVQVTGLFEAFMKSLPIESWKLDGEELTDLRRIPSEAMEYFAHESAPDDLRTAYLYAVVHKYRDNWFSTYRMYEPLIQPFMMDQLYKSRINAGLAYLYDNILQPSKLPENQTEGFLNICRSHRVTGLPVESGILKIHYTHSEITMESPVSGYEAIIPVYGKCYEVSIVHFTGSETKVTDAVMAPMMDISRWQRVFADRNISNILYHMAEAEDALETHALEEKLPSIKYILSEDAITEAFKYEAAEQLLPYWDINGAYDQILDTVPYIFTEYGTYSKEMETAFWKQQYLKSHIGIYGMQYLIDHYEGSLSEQGGIFKKAAGLGIETGGYAENLLLEMMQSGQVLPIHTEIFEAYCSMEGYDTEIVQQYLEFRAEACYLKEQKLEAVFLKKQAELSLKGYSFSLVAKLAYLHSIVSSGVGSIDEQQSESAKQYIKELLSQNIYFSWMQPLVLICSELSSMEAFQVLEYRGEAGCPVWVRFSKYTDGKEEAESLQSEVMEEICAGIYTKSFIMFFGERMHYEVYGLEGTENKLLKQGVLQRGQGLSEQSTSRFSRLNQMLLLRSKKQNLDLYQELENYYGRSAMVEQLFTLK